jgi:ABC-2 type transport system permease protein
MILTFFRDKALIFFTIVLPLLALPVFAVVHGGDSTVRAKVAQIGDIGLLDSLDDAERAEVDGTLTITKLTDESTALADVKKGDYDALIEQGPGNTLVLRYSTADPTIASIVRTNVNSLVQQANLDDAGEPATYSLQSSEVESEKPDPIEYLTPGLLGWGVATGAVFNTALALVSLRRRQVLRRMRLAPISAATIMASRIAITMIIALAQTALFVLVASLPWFGLTLTGDWWLVVPLVLCATLAFMSVGVLVGSYAKNEESANGLAQLLVLPMSLMSGAFFPLDNAPDWLQTIGHVMPLQYLVEGSETVLSQGGGLLDVLPTMGGMLFFAAVLGLIAWRFFAWGDD